METFEEAGGRAWLSAHLYFQGELYGDVADRWILRGVEPIVREALEKEQVEGWFFLRYGDLGGPHVRLRLLVPREEARRLAVRRLVERQVAALARQEAPGPRLAWVPYEPEVERYGGPEGVLLAERIFEVSSVAALALLEKESLRQGPERGRSGRLGKGLLAMLTTIHAFAPRRRTAAALAAAYAEGYLAILEVDPRQRERCRESHQAAFRQQSTALGSHVEEGWAALREGRSLPPELDAYRRSLEGAARRFRDLVAAGRMAGEAGGMDLSQATVGIVTSYIHMMSNRLGVTQMEEVYLATLSSLVLTRPVGAFAAKGAP